MVHFLVNACVHECHSEKVTMDADVIAVVKI